MDLGAVFLGSDPRKAAAQSGGEAIVALGRAAAVVLGDDAGTGALGHLLIGQARQALDAIRVGTTVPAVITEVAEIAVEHFFPCRFCTQQPAKGVVSGITLAVVFGQIVERNAVLAAVEVVAVIDIELCIGAGTGSVGNTAHKGDAGDGTRHVRELHVSVAVIESGLTIRTVGAIDKVGEAGGEAAAAHTADIDIGIGAGDTAEIHLDLDGRAAVGKDIVAAAHGNTLLQGLLSNGDGTAGVAVRYRKAHTAGQTAYTHIVAVAGGVHVAVGIDVGAVDLQIHHGGTLVEVDAGDTHQPADGGLTQMLFVTAVVGHSVAGDGAVGDAAVAHAAVVVIGDAHQTSQGVGGGILAHRPGAAGGRGIGIALDDGAVVTIKDDVRDLCAGGGAEEARCSSRSRCSRS